MKKYIKRIVLSILLFCVTLAALGFVNGVLVLKRSDGITPVKQLYAQDKNSVDVLVLGSSHAGMNLDTATLWQEHGIASYVLWGSVQPFWNSYHFLIEALDTQQPEVVVLDVYAATFHDNYSDSSRQITNVCGMKYNLNRWEASKVSTKKDNQLDLFLGMPKYHSRYLEISKNDFAYFPWVDELQNKKGTSCRYGVGDYSVVDVSHVKDVEEISEKEEKYLIKIIELCKEKNLPLVLIKTPTVGRTGQQPYYNRVQQIADEYGLDFINFNLLDSETGLTKDDIWTDGHLNMNGVRKTTKYLGDWLVQHYDIKNRQNDPNYNSWSISTQNILNQYVHIIKGNDDYFTELKSRDLSVVAVKYADCDDTQEYSDFKTLISGIGLSDAWLNSDCDAWYIDDTSNGVPENKSINSTTNTFKLENLNCTVRFSEEKAEILINGDVMCEISESGYALLVYDKETNEIVDKAKFLQSESFKITR